jgi:succinate-acetate transporter protein
MGATAFCSFGMGYIIAATFIWMQAGGIIPATSMNHQMLAIGLFCFAYIAAMLAVAALRANSVYLLTLLALVPGYALAGVQQFGGPATIGHIGGWFLVAAALLAFYAAGAVVVNSQWCREVLPMGMRER